MYEFLFCPIHGIFGAANWPMIAPIISHVLVGVRQTWISVVDLVRKF